MSYDYSGKTVVVTGGTGQVGRIITQAYVEAGATVVAADRMAPANVAEWKNPSFQHIDVLHEDSVREFFEHITRQYGSLYALVNTIGGYHAGEAVTEMSLEDFEGQLELNLKTAFLLTKYAVQTMSKSGGGKIVHFSSRAAVEKGAKSFAYSVSKQGVVRLVEAVAGETRDQNININAVMPSLIDTPANRKAMPDADFSKWPKAEQVSKVLLFLTSPDAELISGAAIPVFGKF
jgi:NAD(P)-dependent dehydrogenase (short-subunit alcohol dehydrogenase family)